MPKPIRQMRRELQDVVLVLKELSHVNRDDMYVGHKQALDDQIKVLEQLDDDLDILRTSLKNGLSGPEPPQ